MGGERSEEIRTLMTLQHCPARSIIAPETFRLGRYMTPNSLDYSSGFVLLQQRMS